MTLTPKQWSEPNRRSAKISVAIAGAFLLFPGCRAQGDQMRTPEHAAQERASQKTVALMSLETMFIDPQSRALASAAAEGDIGEIERLVAKGVDVNSRGARNATPLFWSFRNIRGFSKLLELGADPNVMFEDGSSVMHWAARNRNLDFLRVALQFGGNPNLISGKNGSTPIFAAAGNSAEAIKLLLDSGADVNSQLYNGDTSVMNAAALGRFDIVYLLLEHGARYDMPNKNGVTLVDRVANAQGAMEPEHELTKWRDKVVEWLQKRGVSISG